MLEERIVGKQRLNEDIVRFCTAEVLLVINHIHSLGFMHRNLQPESIYIEDSGNIKLFNFDWLVSVSRGLSKYYWERLG